MKQPKVNVWKELLDFWPLSIVVPGLLLSILIAYAFSPPEKLWRSQRNDCIRKWYRILSSKRI